MKKNYPICNSIIQNCLNVFSVRNLVFEILFFLIICKAPYETEMADCPMVAPANAFLMTSQPTIVKTQVTSAESSA